MIRSRIGERIRASCLGPRLLVGVSPAEHSFEHGSWIIRSHYGIDSVFEWHYAGKISISAIAVEEPPRPSVAHLAQPDVGQQYELRGKKKLSVLDRGRSLSMTP